MGFGKRTPNTYVKKWSLPLIHGASGNLKASAQQRKLLVKQRDSQQNGRKSSSSTHLAKDWHLEYPEGSKTLINKETMTESKQRANTIPSGQLWSHIQMNNILLTEQLECAGVCKIKEKDTVIWRERSRECMEGLEGGKGRQELYNNIWISKIKNKFKITMR